MLLGSKNETRVDTTGATGVSCFLLVLFFATARTVVDGVATGLNYKNMMYSKNSKNK